jgi:phosphoethanolamine N-methyltransferase
MGRVRYVVFSKDAIVQIPDEIEARDRNAWYRDLARRELAALEGELRPLVTERIGAEKAEHFVNNWRQRVLILERGELRPTHLKARK